MDKITDEEIERQLGFVEWLKSAGIYNPMESAHTMRKMQAVYMACRSEKLPTPPSGDKDNE